MGRDAGEELSQYDVRIIQALQAMIGHEVTGDASTLDEELRIADEQLTVMETADAASWAAVSAINS